MSSPLLLILFFTLCLLSLFFLTFSICFHKNRQKKQDDTALFKTSFSKIVEEAQITWETDPTHLKVPLLLEKTGDGFCTEAVDSGGDQGGGSKKKKKRGNKKKRLDSISEQKCLTSQKIDSVSRSNPELVCLYPFTSTSSAIQRKIKLQYDQLVKCHEAKGLTLAQVGDFANCLIDARHELQHKSEVIKRKFTITKALLFKADRSSFERLRQQIYKLEMEQKRLEEDTFVYNWLQQQLKLSPAYKKMLEIGACMELKAKSGELKESVDRVDEFADISFEELLAQEKKDSFWQKNGRPRTFPTC